MKIVAVVLLLVLTTFDVGGRLTWAGHGGCASAAYIAGAAVIVAAAATWDAALGILVSMLVIGLAVGAGGL